MIFIIAGLFGGFLAGFLGLGGGILVVPTMLFMGFTMKFAIGISITQMVFSSIIGTISNIKKQKHLLKKGLLLGIGGSLGGLFSGVIVNFTPTYILEYSFLGFILLAIISVYKNKQTEISPKDKQTNPYILIIAGFVTACIAMSLGIGGGLILIPFLSSILKYDLKTCATLMLFFLIFSSSTAFASLSFNGFVPYKEALLVSCGSILGVLVGTYTRNKTNMQSYKKFILTLYIITFCVSFYKIVL